MEENKKSKAPKIIIFILALVVCIVCAIYIASILFSRHTEDKAYSDLKKDVVTLEEVQNAEFNGEQDGDAPELPTDVSAEGTDSTEKSIDFDKLQSYNSELVAWVQIPDTNIDYPVARHAEGDQDFYLYHNMYQEPAYSGCIYMENTNAGEFTDNNTILYGHNMKNGSMFRNLHEFENSDFFDKNEYVYVYTPGHKLTYQIFAAYTTDATKLTLAYDFSDADIYARYLKDVLNMRSMDVNIRDGVKVTNKDKILTMSTCTGGQPDKRYLVQGVLTDDVETK